MRIESFKDSRKRRLVFDVGETFRARFIHSEYLDFRTDLLDVNHRDKVFEPVFEGGAHGSISTGKDLRVDPDGDLIITIWTKDRDDYTICVSAMTLEEAFKTIDEFLKNRP